MSARRSAAPAGRSPGGARLRGILAAALVALSLPACAYFNSLYNARRLYGQAQRAESKGDRATARTDYGQAVEKARKSLKRAPHGRWSDDALYLIGRSQFALAQYDSARVSFTRLLPLAGDRRMRAEAHAYLGASEVRIDDAAAGLVQLDSALAVLEPGQQATAFAHLWRARARFAADDSAGAWRDLEAAAGAPGTLGRDARLEAVRRAVVGGGRARAAAALGALFRDPDADGAADSIAALARAAAERWGADTARSLLEPVGKALWTARPRSTLLLERAQLAEEAGDTASARREAHDLAQAADARTAARARVRLARWELARVSDLPGLASVRATLLPAVADAEAQALLHGLKTVEVLAGLAASGQPLALFEAAELARDVLAAPVLARRFFTSYADLVPRSPWAAKALLAAAAVAPAGAARDSLRRRLEGYDGNVYLAAVRGTAAEPGAFSDAEERLSAALSALRTNAEHEAEGRDAGVAQAVAALDSVKKAAEADSVHSGVRQPHGQPGAQGDPGGQRTRRVPAAGQREAGVLPPGRHPRLRGHDGRGPPESAQPGPGHPRALTGGRLELAQELFGTTFQNPVLLASGTCGYGEELSELIELDALGGLVTKGLTLEPRAGNPAPRVAEFGAGMLNSVGLANVGLDAFRAEKLPWLAQRLRRARVLVNVAGATVEEFARLVAALDGEAGFHAFELNVSCPNVKEGGALFSAREDLLAAVVRACRAATSRPLVVKLAPNVPDIGRMAEVVVGEGADGLTLVNTHPGLLFDLETRRPVLGQGPGGVSGPALLPIGVHAVWQARRRVDVPILGVGGIRTAEDAMQYLLAGASLVQVGTASFADPRAAARVLSGLERLGRRQRVADVRELVGAAHAGGRAPSPHKAAHA